MFKQLTGMFYLIDNRGNNAHIFPTRNSRDMFYEDQLGLAFSEDDDVKMDYISSATPMTRDQAQITAEYQWKDLEIINHY